MTEEEKKAIKYFKEHITYFKEQINFIETVDCDYYDEEYELYKNRVKQFEMVLNLVKKLQEEKENYKRMLAETHVQSLNSSIAENGKHEEQLEALNDGWKIELEKKDKIIYLMAEYIDFDKMNLQCSSLCVKKDCQIECIKQYFEKKVEG